MRLHGARSTGALRLHARVRGAACADVRHSAA